MISIDELNEALKAEGTIYFCGYDYKIIEIPLKKDNPFFINGNHQSLQFNKPIGDFGDEFSLYHLFVSKENCLQTKNLSIPVIRTVKAPSYNELIEMMADPQFIDEYVICQYIKNEDFFDGHEKPIIKVTCTKLSTSKTDSVKLLVLHKLPSDNFWDILYEENLTPENYIDLFKRIHKDQFSRDYMWED